MNARSIPAPHPRAPVLTGAQLVVRAQSGDREAFRELHARYGRMVHAILLNRVPPEHADDLVQDVFVQALDRIGGLKNPERVGPWLGSIARNKATDFLRRRRPLELLDEQVAQRHRPVVEAMQALRVLRTLQDDYAELLIMRLVEGMTGPEIAQRTGMTPGSVRVKLHRGMKQLRSKLGVEVT